MLYICCMKEIKGILVQQTNGLFSEKWYDDTAKKIENYFIDNQDLGGYVYFVKNGSDCRETKIGCTNSLDSRLSSFKTSFNNNVYVLGYIYTKDYTRLESIIHKDLKKYRKKGEWFDIDDIELIQYISEAYNFTRVLNTYSNKHQFEKVLANPTHISLEEKEIEGDFAKLVNFCRSLKVGKTYKTQELFREYSSIYGSKHSNMSWFGRDLNKALKMLRYRVDKKNSKGVRSFTII